jgi:ParB-like chromosome segregation protein Spo0J
MIIESHLISGLVADPDNARTHDEKNIEAIRGSLLEFGQCKPIVVWGNIVVAGNGTLEAAKRLGWTEIVITRVPSSWDSNRARAYSLADNRTGELADWDSWVLADHLIDLDSVGFSVEDWGFEPLVPPLDPEPFEPKKSRTEACDVCGLQVIPERKSGDS